MNWLESAFIDYMNAVDHLLELRGAFTSTEEELAGIAAAQEDGMSPTDCVDLLVELRGIAS